MSFRDELREITIHGRQFTTEAQRQLTRTRLRRSLEQMDRDFESTYDRMAARKALYHLVEELCRMAASVGLDEVHLIESDEYETLTVFVSGEGLLSWDRIVWDRIKELGLRPQGHQLKRDPMTGKVRLSISASWAD